MKIDLHNHTNASFDSLTRPEDLVRAAASRGIDALAITDHNTIANARIAERLGKQHNVQVITGAEIMCTEGDIIGLYLLERIKPARPFLEILDDIRSQGALAYVPHPYDDTRRGLADEKLLANVDIIEVINAKNVQSKDVQAAALANKLAKLHGAASDSHTSAEVGRAYVETPGNSIRSPEELLKELKKGRPALIKRTHALEKVVRRMKLFGHRLLSKNSDMDL